MSSLSLYLNLFRVAVILPHVYFLNLPKGNIRTVQVVLCTRVAEKAEGKLKDSSHSALKVIFQVLGYVEEGVDIFS